MRQTRFTERLQWLGIVGYAICGLAVAHAKPAIKPDQQLLRVSVTSPDQLDGLVQLDHNRRDVEIWSHDLALGVLDVRASKDAVSAIAALGCAIDVQIADLGAKYEELFPGTYGGGAASVDFFDDYRTYDEHVAFMENLAASFPDLAQRVDLGTSVQGRILWAIRITGPGDDKPGVFYHGAQHGNEIMGAAAIAYIANHLLNNYESDPEVAELVDGVEWFLLPLMNPDGYEAGSRYNANGVDLNRNWGGPGSGQNAFSEPETVAMRDLLEAHTNIQAHVDFHSYGYMILWPWGHTPEPPIDNGTFDLVGDAMAEEILAVNGTDYPLRGPINTTIYPVNGGSLDYSYGELGLWAYVFEIGYGFYMPPAQIVPMSQEMLAALGYLASWVLDCDDDGVSNAQAIANGTSQDANQNGIPDECEALLIVSSEPPDGAIDARQPSQPDGSDAAGWDSLFLTFTGNTEALGPEDFTITTDPPGQAPSVTDVTALDGGAVLQFNQIIPLTAWTMVTHEASGSNVRIGYLPADVNNDRISSASDVLFVIDVLNGLVDPEPAAYQTDIDRSGATNASDVLRVIDLLNGAGEYDVWLGASLPE